jgi:5-methylcytosine-specific restriction enzyme A
MVQLATLWQRESKSGNRHTLRGNAAVKHIRSRRQAGALRQIRVQAERTPQAKRGPKPDPNRKPKRSDRRWGELRAAQLEREPVCRECAKVGKQRPATEVDHVVAIADGGSFDEPSNHQGLCDRHHWQKTEDENAGRAGRKPRKVRGRAAIDPATGFPLPGSDHWWAE